MCGQGACSFRHDFRFGSNGCASRVVSAQCHVLRASKVTGPDRLGHPTRRARRLTAGIAKAGWIWRGPAQGEIEADFHAAFGRNVDLTGDIYFVATEEEQKAEEDRLAAIRRTTVRPGACLKGFDLVKARCPPSQQRHWLGYENIRNKKGIKDGDTFLADMEQDPYRGRSRAGVLWPSQLTHGHIYSWKKERFATALEHAAAQGIHISPSCSGTWKPSPLAAIFQNRSPAQLRHLMGNTMHLTTQYAWMLYVFAHICPISPPKITELGPPASADDCDDAEASAPVPKFKRLRSADFS